MSILETRTHGKSVSIISQGDKGYMAEKAIGKEDKPSARFADLLADLLQVPPPPEKKRRGKKKGEEPQLKEEDK